MHVQFMLDQALKGTVVNRSYIEGYLKFKQQFPVSIKISNIKHIQYLRRKVYCSVWGMESLKSK